MTYIRLVTKINDIDVYLEFLKGIETFEENNKIKSKILQMFSCFLDKKHPYESFYIMNKMNEQNILDSKYIKNLSKPNSVYYSDTQSNYYYVKILKNDFELHKKYVKEGNNPNEIAQIIRNDEIEKLQEISSHTNFDFNQYVIPSLYEKYSFINKDNVSLIDYAAFFGSVKCFKYLLMNGAKVENTGKYAISGGNEEIIHLCEQNHSSFKDAYETAIQYHKNDIFKYLYENKIDQFNDLEFLGEKCILYYNFEILSYLIEEGMKINDKIINTSAKIGNLYLTKHFLQNKQIPKDILNYSFDSKNIEHFKYILEQEGIDINAKDIYLFYLIFILIILDFKIIFGNDLIYLEQRLFVHLYIVIQK